MSLARFSGFDAQLISSPWKHPIQPKLEHQQDCQGRTGGCVDPHQRFCLLSCVECTQSSELRDAIDCQRSQDVLYAIRPLRLLELVLISFCVTGYPTVKLRLPRRIPTFFPF